MYSLGGLPRLRCLSLEGSERLRDIHLRVLAVRRVTLPPENAADLRSEMPPCSAQRTTIPCLQACVAVELLTVPCKARSAC